jgi:hypothetical protein
MVDALFDADLQRRDAMFERINGIGINLFDHVWTPTLTNPPTVPAESLIAFKPYHANYLKAAGVKFIRILTDPTFYWIGNQPGVAPYASTPGLKALFMEWVQTCVTAGLPVLVSFRDRSASTIQPNVPAAPFHMAVSTSDEMVESYGQFLRGFCTDLAAISQTMIMVNPNQEPNVSQYTRQGTICGQASLVNPTVAAGTLSIKLFGLDKLDIVLASGRTPAQVASDINAAIAANGDYTGKVNACIMLNRLLITGTNTANMLESVKTSSVSFGANLGLKRFTGEDAITYVPGDGVSFHKKEATQRWNKIQTRMIEYMREGAPLMTFVPIGADFGTLEASLRAGMPGCGDRNVIYDICHLYEPIISQQGQIGANQYLYQSPYPVTPPTITSRTTTVTRSTTGQVDPIDPQYTPLYLPGAATVSIPGYTYTTDYTVTNNAVIWVSGMGPALGATYPLTHQYYDQEWLNEVIAKPPVRVVDTTIVRGAGATDTLNAAYGDLVPSTPNQAANGIRTITQGATNYVEGVNWTVSGNIITWIGAKPETASTYTGTFFVTRSLALQAYVINNTGITVTPSLTQVAYALTVSQNYASTGYGTANLRARIKLIADVAKRNNLKVLMGEFGMPKQSDNATPIRTYADQASNTAYYQDFVEALNDFGVPGLFWELRSGSWGAFSLSGNDNGSTVSGINNSDLRQTWVADALGFTGANPIS